MPTTRIPIEALSRPNHFDDPEPIKFERCNRYTLPATTPDEWEIATYNDPPHKLARQYFSGSLKIGMLKLQISRIVQALFCDFKSSAEFEEVPDPSDASKLEQEFNERANRWEREAAIHSSPAAKFLHKDYQVIMAKGEKVIPLILKRLETSRKDWFWALSHIAGEKENPAKEAKDFAGAVVAWREWARKHHYIP